MPSASCYNVVVFGEPGVGKTCFIDQFCYGKSFVNYDPGNSALSHKIVVDARTSNLTLMDLSTSFLKPENTMQRPEWAEKMLRDADGVVLLYDVTRLESLEYVIKQAYNFVWRCRKLESERNQGAGRDKQQSFGCVLAGNKLDLVITGKEERAVTQGQAEEWAHTQGFRSVELHSLARDGPELALGLLLKNVWKLGRLGFMEMAEKEQAERSKGKENGRSMRDTFKEVLRLPAF